MSQDIPVGYGTPQQVLDASDPEWRWIAMDEDGDWYLYANEPVADYEGGLWMCRHDNEWPCSTEGLKIHFLGQWDDSLHKRGGVR